MRTVPPDHNDAKPSLYSLRRATFRFALDQWHRGVEIGLLSHSHWHGYEPISIASEQHFIEDGEEYMDVTVWFRKATGSALRCEKCGSDDLATSLHPRRSYCNPHSRYTFNSSDAEHLHRTCRTCGFDWTEDCADAA